MVFLILLEIFTLPFPFSFVIVIGEYALFPQKSKDFRHG